MTADRRGVRDRIRRLGSRRGRDGRGRFLLEGVAPFLQACAAGIEFELVLHSRVLLRPPSAQKQVRLLRRRGVTTVHLTPEEYREFSVSARAAGVLAVCRQAWSRLDTVRPSCGLCWIAVERIRSPGNLGTIARSAEAVGAAGLIFLSGASDPYDPAALRASMGSIFHLRLVRATLGELAGWAERKGAHLVATSPRARRPYTDLPPDGPLVLLLGDEREGLSPTAFARSSVAVRLPILGHGNSLNVGVAAGVLLYETLRQRGARR